MKNNQDQLRMSCIQSIKSKIALFTLVAGLSLMSISFTPVGAGNPALVTDKRAEVRDTIDRISAEQPWAERMAQSIMKRNPEAWMTDFRKTPRWSYTHGVIMSSLLKLWEKTGDTAYYDYAKSYADTMIDENGQIKGYHIDEYNIDHVNPGKMLFTLYQNSSDGRYLTTIKTLRKQLQWQPRTHEGGFWHKLRYTWQMWLDGLYMGAPFYAQYAHVMQEPESFGDIALQFHLIEKHTKDAETGLLYHGYDESRIQRWSDPETGCSPNFWGRSMGWYGMALVDVLEFFPESHPDRDALIRYLDAYVSAIEQVQDSESGLWYQVLDQGNRDGNYLEATASCMFVYTIAKAVNNGWIGNEHHETAVRGFKGITDELIRVDSDGEIHLENCCSVAGLGGSPYRDGSYAYYLSEKVRDNDPKGTGPFILAAIELEKERVNAKN